MTAPDDVRARFELVMVSAVSPDNNARYGLFPSYEQAEAVAKLLIKADAEDSPEWCGYLIDRAALAYLSGEVRELAEEVIEAINDGDAQSARNAAQAALDKYAHQEKDRD